MTSPGQSKSKYNLDFILGNLPGFFDLTKKEQIKFLAYFHTLIYEVQNFSISDIKDIFERFGLPEPSNISREIVPLTKGKIPVFVKNKFGYTIHPIIIKEISGIFSNRKPISKEKVPKILKPKKANHKTSYIINSKSLIQKLKAKNDGFNYIKLISLINELNFNYANFKPYSCLNLVRSIMDHIPPLFGFNNFEEMVSNYKWPTKTDHDYMESLVSQKLVSHDSLHRPISKSEDQIDMSSIPNPTMIRKLIQLCCESEITLNKYKESQTNNKKVFEIINNNIIIVPKGASQTDLMNLNQTLKHFPGKDIIKVKLPDGKIIPVSYGVDISSPSFMTDIKKVFHKN